MEKLKAKLLICEPSLHRYLRYDCQNTMFILGLFPVGNYKNVWIVFFSVLFHQLLERLCCLLVSGDQSVGSEK